MDKQFGSDNSHDRHHSLLVAIFIILLLILLGLIGWGLYYFKVWPFNNRTTDNSSTQQTSNNNNSGNNNTTITDTPTPTVTTTSPGSTATPTATPTTSTALLNFYAGVNQGDTKQEVTGMANGLSKSCTVTVNTTLLGKQEVCTYTDGSKVVTVIYQDDEVVSVFRP